MSPSTYHRYSNGDAALHLLSATDYANYKRNQHRMAQPYHDNGGGDFRNIFHLDSSGDFKLEEL